MNYDPINNIILEETDGGYVFKVTRVSCKTGYITTKGISGKPENAIIISGLQSVTLDTFAQLQSYDFTSTPTRFNIFNDEDKGQENTAYNWTGSILKWNAEVVDDFQPTI